MITTPNRITLAVSILLLLVGGLALLAWPIIFESYQLIHSRTPPRPASPAAGLTVVIVAAGLWTVSALMDRHRVPAKRKRPPPGKPGGKRVTLRAAQRSETRRSPPVNGIAGAQRKKKRRAKLARPRSRATR
jgi:hypothetical protein